MPRIASLGVVPLLALTLAAPANAQTPPGGGLVDFGQLECDGLGTVSVVGPRGVNAPTGFTATGQQLIAQSISGTFTDLSGQQFSFSKTYGTKSAFDTFTCTQSFEEPGEGSGTLTLEVAVIPPGA